MINVAEMQLIRDFRIFMVHGKSESLSDNHICKHQKPSTEEQLYPAPASPAIQFIDLLPCVN